MRAKITLYSDEALIDRIKAYAKEKHTSVSALTEAFFRSLLEKESHAPITDSLAGILKESDIDIESYRKHLEERYL